MRLLVDRRRHCVHSAGSELRCKLSSRDSCLCTLCKASTSSTSQSGRRASSSAVVLGYVCVRSLFSRRPALLAANQLGISRRRPNPITRRAAMTSRDVIVTSPPAAAAACHRTTDRPRSAVCSAAVPPAGERTIPSARCRRIMRPSVQP